MENKPLEELSKIHEQCLAFAKNINKVGDSVLFIGTISEGENSKAAISIAGSNQSSTIALLEAMKKETQIAKIIIQATKMYMYEVKTGMNLKNNQYCFRRNYR